MTVPSLTVASCTETDARNVTVEALKLKVVDASEAVVTVESRRSLVSLLTDSETEKSATIENTSLLMILLCIRFPPESRTASDNGSLSFREKGKIEDEKSTKNVNEWRHIVHALSYAAHVVEEVLVTV